MSEASLSFASRIWVAIWCFVRVLVDGGFAWRARQVRHAMPALAESDDAPGEAADDTDGVTDAGADAAEQPAGDGDRDAAQQPAPGGVLADGAFDTTAALVLLGLFQREGRLVDFLEQDIASFEDAEVGAAARVVHDGCRKALQAHASVRPVHESEEESHVTVPEGYDASSLKLTGDVGGKAPYRGVLRHRGWRIAELTLPVPVDGHDSAVVAPAEVEV